MNTDLFSQLKTRQKAAAGAGVHEPTVKESLTTALEVKASATQAVRPAEKPEAGQAFHIENINGVTDFTVTLDEPGVYVCLGENGAGKSSVIEAIKGACGDKDALVAPTEGMETGRVDMGGGVLFRIGNKRTSKGQPSVNLLSNGAIGELIEPGLVDDKAAARKRLKAVMKLIALPADEAARQELTQNDAELWEWIKRDTSIDAMDLERNVHAKANELALALEKRVDECNGEDKSLQGLIEELGPLDFDAGEYETAKAAADAALKEAEVLNFQATERRKLEAMQFEIRATLGERPDSAQAVKEIDQLSAEIAELDMLMERKRALLQAAKTVRVNRDEAARKWDSQAEILKREITGPTMDEAGSARAEAEALAGRAVRAQTLARANEWLAKADAARAEALEKAERAKLLRGIATGTTEALGRLLARRNLTEIAVVDGRLHWRTGERLLDYGSPMVSFGQRVRVALEIALKGIDRDSVESVTSGNRLPLLPLAPEFWTALSPAKKAEVAQIARERGVCLITEEPADGGLRVERVPNVRMSEGADK